MSSPLSPETYFGGQLSSRSGSAFRCVTKSIEEEEDTKKTTIIPRCQKNMHTQTKINKHRTTKKTYNTRTDDAEAMVWEWLGVIWHMFGELSVDVVSIIEGIASHPSREILKRGCCCPASSRADFLIYFDMICCFRLWRAHWIILWVLVQFRGSRFVWIF